MATDSNPDRRVVIEKLLEWTDEITAKEVNQALTQLDAIDELPDEQRAVVTDLGRRLGHRVIAAPIRALEDADSDDEEMLKEALQLFSTQYIEDSSDR